MKTHPLHIWPSLKPSQNPESYFSFNSRNSMTKPLNLIKANASNPKVWVVIGVTVAGIVVLLAETRRRRQKAKLMMMEGGDFGAFIERFEIRPFPQPPPPAAKQSLSALTFAIKDMFVFSLTKSSVFFYFYMFLLNLLLLGGLNV